MGVREELGLLVARVLPRREVLLTWPLDRLPKQLFRDFEKSSFHRVNRPTH